MSEKENLAEAISAAAVAKIVVTLISIAKSFSKTRAENQSAESLRNISEKLREIDNKIDSAIVLIKQLGIHVSAEIEKAQLESARTSLVTWLLQYEVERPDIINGLSSKDDLRALRRDFSTSVRKFYLTAGAGCFSLTFIAMATERDLNSLLLKNKATSRESIIIGANQYEAYFRTASNAIKNALSSRRSESEDLKTQFDAIKHERLHDITRRFTSGRRQCTQKVYVESSGDLESGYKFHEIEMERQCGHESPGGRYLINDLPPVDTAEYSSPPETGLTGRVRDRMESTVKFWNGLRTRHFQLIEETKFFEELEVQVLLCHETSVKHLDEWADS